MQGVFVKMGDSHGEPVKLKAGAIEGEPFYFQCCRCGSEELTGALLVDLPPAAELVSGRFELKPHHVAVLRQPGRIEGKLAVYCAEHYQEAIIEQFDSLLPLNCPEVEAEWTGRPELGEEVNQ